MLTREFSDGCTMIANTDIMTSGVRTDEKLRRYKDLKRSLVKMVPAFADQVESMIRDWLTSSSKLLSFLPNLLPSNMITDLLSTEEPQIVAIRESYLPEVVLACIVLLHEAGHQLSRDHFLQALDFSTLIAAESSDVSELFLKKGRMKDLVEMLAQISKCLLLANEQRKDAALTTKKRRALGWSNKIWDVKD